MSKTKAPRKTALKAKTPVKKAKVAAKKLAGKMAAKVTRKVTDKVAKKPPVKAKSKPVGSNVIWKLLEAKKKQRQEQLENSGSPRGGQNSGFKHLQDSHGKVLKFAGPRRRAV